MRSLCLVREESQEVSALPFLVDPGLLLDSCAGFLRTRRGAQILVGTASTLSRPSKSQYTWGLLDVVPWDELLTFKVRVPLFSGLGEAVGGRPTAVEAPPFGFGDALRNRVSRLSCGRSSSSSEESTTFLLWRFAGGAIEGGGRVAG